MAHAVAVERSDNAKLGPVAATYVSQHSCPKDCPFLGSGCYAEHGYAGIITRRLNNAGAAGSVDIAREEAEAIDRLTGKKDLRLHVVGDANSDGAARVLATAAKRYRQRGGWRSKVWTYTHAWRRVRRQAWGGHISVLASCETPDAVREAHQRGYATALVVPAFRQRNAHNYGGIRLLPCPQQTTEGVTCASCRLCTDGVRLRKAGLTIGFLPHETGATSVRMALPVLS